MAVAMDAMAVAIHIKYALSQNIHLIFYWHISGTAWGTEAVSLGAKVGKKKRQYRVNIHNNLLPWKNCKEE